MTRWLAETCPVCSHRMAMHFKPVCLCCPAVPQPLEIQVFDYTLLTEIMEFRALAPAGIDKHDVWLELCDKGLIGGNNSLVQLAVELDDDWLSAPAQDYLRAMFRLIGRNPANGAMFLMQW